MLVAHELGPLAALVDRAVVMRDGRVVYDGAPLADHAVHDPDVRRVAHPPPPRPTRAATTTSPTWPSPLEVPAVNLCGAAPYGFMQRALIAAAFTGLAAPAVGTYLVQRRLALMGDGIGHVAVTGVALGLLTGASPTWTAVVVAMLGAVLIEVIRERGHTNGDVALALLFYGGLAGGVLLTGLGGQSAARLQEYLFGSITTISVTRRARHDGAGRGRGRRRASGLAPQLFAVAQDQEFARVAGLRVRAYNLLVAVLAAVSVTVAMRTVGLLLVSALMVVPVATSQQLTRSFRTTLLAAMVLGTARLGRRAGARRRSRPYHATGRARPDDRAALAGRLRGHLAGRGLAAAPRPAARAVPRRARRPSTTRPADTHPHEHGPDCGHVAVPHGDHVDYVHDGHRHAAHGEHYDEH